MRKPATLQAIAFLFPSIELRKKLAAAETELAVERGCRDDMVNAAFRKKAAAYKLQLNGEITDTLTDLSNIVRRHELAMRHAHDDLLAGAPPKAVAQFLIREVESTRSRVFVPCDIAAAEWSRAISASNVVLHNSSALSFVPSAVIDAFTKILRNYAP
mgnify:FL=1